MLYCLINTLLSWNRNIFKDFYWLEATTKDLKISLEPKRFWGLHLSIATCTWKHKLWQSHNFWLKVHDSLFSFCCIYSLPSEYSVQRTWFVLLLSFDELELPVHQLSRRDPWHGVSGVHQKHHRRCCHNNYLKIYTVHFVGAFSSYY